MRLALYVAVLAITLTGCIFFIIQKVQIPKKVQPIGTQQQQLVSGPVFLQGDDLPYTEDVNAALRMCIHKINEERKVNLQMLNFRSKVVFDQLSDLEYVFTYKAYTECLCEGIGCCDNFEPTVYVDEEVVCTLDTARESITSLTILRELER